jgi:hypothetical protein
MYTTIGSYYTFSMTVVLVGLHNSLSSKKNNKYQLLHTYGCTS